MQHTTWEIINITLPADLQKVAEELSSREILSIDTETVGWETGNERLCLIQIGDPETEKVYLVDVVTLSDISALRPLIESPSPALIAHNAAFEERQLARHGLRMRGSIDTLKMARELRSDLPSRTLKSCCKFILGLDISKEQQSSNWETRPLSSEQIDYAALDAEVTWKLYVVLHEMEQKLIINTNQEVSGLMAELFETEKQAFAMIAGIAAELELYKLRREALRETIRGKLINGAPPYKGAYGECSIQRIKRTEVIPDKVREFMPEIAKQVIVESVSRERLKNIMEEHGIDKTLLEKVTDIIRYDDRLILELSDF